MSAPQRTSIGEIRERLRREHKVYRDDAGREYIYVPCHHCGGSGRYPSSMIPPGQCRFYCWQDRTPETYGKLPKLLERVAQSIQRAERAAEKAEATREQREAEAKQRAEAARASYEAERLAREAREAARLAASEYVGKVGERIELPVVAERVLSFDGQFGPFYIVAMRDDAGHAIVYKGGSPPLREGERAIIRATVAEQVVYNSERQTRVARVATRAAAEVTP